MNINNEIKNKNGKFKLEVIYYQLLKCVFFTIGNVFNSI